MAYIGKSPVIGNFVKLDAITAVNGQAAYTMQNGSVNFTDYSTVNQFLVSLNGTIQSPGSSFTVSGSTLTFASNLSTGDVIDFIIVFGNSLSAGTPTDATVSTAKIVDDAVTTAKIASDAVTPPKANFFNNDPGNAADLGMLHIKSGDSGLSSLGDNDADELVIEGSANSGISILSGSGNAGRIYFGDSGDVNVGFMHYAHDDNAFLFGTNAATKMAIQSDGSIKLHNTPPIKTFDLGTTATVTIADNGHIEFTNTSGAWFVTEQSQTGLSAILLAGGGQTAIGGQTGSSYNASDSGSFRWYRPSGQGYYFKNAQGNSCTFAICHISLRNSN
jgi:hypothetical protein